MKYLFKICTLLFLLSTTSCYGQKMVQNISNAKNLEINKEQFIGKPLKVLLKQIEPKIKFVSGNPDNTWAGAIGGTYLEFYFIGRKEFGEKLRKNQKPISIIVNFQLEPKNNRKPLPKEGLKTWTENEIKEYGDMVIMNIRITGD